MLPLLFMGLLSPGVAGVPVAASDPPLVILSLDGFRWDYLDHYGDVLPNFMKFRKESSWVPYGLMNAFITKTFPNHRTLITGQWEETHGIVANHFWDPNLQETFSLSVTDIAFWNASEPLWKVAESQGVTSGCFQYPGCDVTDQMPTYTLGLPYKDDYDFETIIDNVTAVIHKEVDPAKFVAFYYYEPDHTGHISGPWSRAMYETLQRLDADIGYMMQQFGPDTNVILTSDHGMNQRRKNLNSTGLTDALTPYTNHLYNNRVQLQVWPKEDEASITRVTEIVLAFQEQNPAMEIYWKHEMPERWHYKHNDRIAPLLLNCPLNYEWSGYDGTYLMGEHGYDNLDHAMHPHFMARGPAFKLDHPVTSQVFSVDVYPLMCEVLGVAPAANNGSLARIDSVLRTRD